jgi:hypothetical protein
VEQSRIGPPGPQITQAGSLERKSGVEQRRRCIGEFGPECPPYDPSLILGQKSIPLCARPIGPALSTPVAVTRGEGVDGERAAILASDTHIIYEYGLCMHAVRFSSVHHA